MHRSCWRFGGERGISNTKALLEAWVTTFTAFSKKTTGPCTLNCVRTEESYPCECFVREVHIPERPGGGLERRVASPKYCSSSSLLYISAISEYHKHWRSLPRWVASQTDESHRWQRSRRSDLGSHLLRRNIRGVQGWCPTETRKNEPPPPCSKLSACDWLLFCSDFLQFISPARPKENSPRVTPENSSRNTFQLLV